MLRSRQELRPLSDSAVKSLDEDFEEPLTPHRLGVFGALPVNLKTTNYLESINALHGQRMDKVHRWRIWDRRQRVGGLVVGLSWIGSGMVTSLGGLYFWYGFGTALTVLPIQAMINGSGYRQAFIIWGIIQGIIVMVISQFMVAAPEGWKPAGWKPVAKVQASQSTVSYTPLQMLGSGTFYLMYFMMALVAFGGLMVTAQLKPIATTYGLDKTVVLLGITALSMALMLDRILNGLTRPFWGWVSDHIGRYNTMALAFALEGCAIIALLRLVNRPLWFVILTGFTFFAWGEIFSLFPATIGDVFGPKYATTNYGIQTAAFLAIAALKPLVARRMARAKLATVSAAAVPAGVTGDD